MLSEDFRKNMQAKESHLEVEGVQVETFHKV
jgi:hypothetical protein